MRLVEPDSVKGQIVAGRDPGLRKEWVVRAEAFLLAQELDPIDKNIADIVADRKKPGRERFRALRSNLTGVLLDTFAFEVDMLQLERDHSSIAGARNKREGNDSAVAAFDFVALRHGFQHCADLLDRRAGLVTARGRDTRDLVRRVEILNVCRIDMGSIASLKG